MRLKPIHTEVKPTASVAMQSLKPFVNSVPDPRPILDSLVMMDTAISTDLRHYLSELDRALDAVANELLPELGVVQNIPQAVNNIKTAVDGYNIALNAMPSTE